MSDYPGQTLRSTPAVAAYLSPGLGIAIVVSHVARVLFLAEGSAVWPVVVLLAGRQKRILCRRHVRNDILAKLSGEALETKTDGLGGAVVDACSFVKAGYSVARVKNGRSDVAWGWFHPALAVLAGKASPTLAAVVGDEVLAPGPILTRGAGALQDLDVAQGPGESWPAAAGVVSANSVVATFAVGTRNFVLRSGVTLTALLTPPTEATDASPGVRVARVLPCFAAVFLLTIHSARGTEEIHRADSLLTPLPREPGSACALKTRSFFVASSSIQAPPGPTIGDRRLAQQAREVVRTTTGVQEAFSAVLTLAPWVGLCLGTAVSPAPPWQTLRESRQSVARVMSGAVVPIPAKHAAVGAVPILTTHSWC